MTDHSLAARATSQVAALLLVALAGSAQAASYGTAYGSSYGATATTHGSGSAGATVTSEPAEVGGGRTVATLTDADGNPIGLAHDA